MEKVLKYSVLRYSPSILSGERINLGILFSEESIGFHSFYYTHRLNRIKSFDDEIDKSVLRDFLIGIEEEASGKWYHDSFDINKFTKYYINDFQFETPQAIIYDNLDTVITRLKKAYFRFDYAKSERPDKNADQKILADIISTAGMGLRRNQKVAGAFNESITYDIVTDEYYIKIFDFDDKDLKRCINTAKTWAWNCNHEKNKPIYIVYRFSEKDMKSGPEFSIIDSIFRETKAHFISMDDFRVFQKITS